MEKKSQQPGEAGWRAQLSGYRGLMEKLYYCFLAVILLYNGLASTPLILMGEAAFGSMTGGMSAELSALLFQTILNLRFLIAIPCIYTLLFEMKDKKQQILAGALLMLGWFYAYYWRENNDTVVFEALLLICASAGRDFRKIAHISMAILASVLAAAFLLCLCGILPDYTMMRGEKIRHAFGTMHCTDLAAHWCYIILTFIFIREGRLKWPEYVLIAVLTILNVLLVDGRTAYLCVLAAAGACVLAAMCRKRRWRIPEGVRKVFRWGMALSFSGFAAFYMILNFTYRNAPDAFYNRIPALRNLAIRLDTSYRVTRVLPFSWFGRYFLQIGDGMGLSGKYGMYTFLDCSYIRVYVMYGIVAFVVFLGILTAIQFRLMREKRDLQMFILSLTAFSCFLEHHMPETGYDIFLLLLLARLPQKYD